MYYPRFPFIENEDYTLEIEYSESLVALHFLMHKDLTPSIYKRLKLSVDQLQDFVETAGYPFLMTGTVEGDEVAEKIALKFGFEHRGTQDGFNVYVRL